METIKQIKEENKRLSSLNLKVIDLKSKNGEDDFMFLEENLREILNERLQKNKIKVVCDLKVFYSLSYSQGDGLCFVGNVNYKGCEFVIKHNSHYYHERSTNVNLENYKGMVLDCLTTKQWERADKIEDEFKELYISICSEIAKAGYEIIEQTQEENILRAGFREWLEENKINEDLELYDLDYKVFKVYFASKKPTKKETKGYIKICDEGDTIFSLWIKDQNLKIKDFVKAKAEITEYQEKQFN